MNKYFTLTKILLKNHFSSVKKGSASKLQRYKSSFLVIIIALAFLPMAGGLFAFSKNAYDVLVADNLTDIIPRLGLSVASMIIFIFGILYVLSELYFSTNVEFLLPLPLRPIQIVGAKLTVVLFYEYLTLAVFFIPVAAGYGIRSNAGIVYYIYTAIIFITLPVIPLTIATLIDMFIMRFSTLFKNKDRFRLIASLLGVFIGIGVNIFSQRFSNVGEKSGEVHDMVLKMNKSVSGVGSKIFPSSNFAADSLNNWNNSSGLLAILIFILLNAIFLIILLYICGALYFKGALGVSESTAKRKKLTGAEIEKNTNQNSAISSLIWKELKILLRTPPYFINCVMMNFLWPVFFIPMMMQKGMAENLSSIHKYVNRDKYRPLVFIVLFGAVTVLGVFNTTTSTAVSREGKHHFFSMYIPVDTKVQLLSKVITGILLNLCSLLLFFIIFIVLAKPSLLLILSILILSIFVIVFNNTLGLLLDINSPKLNWDNETKAVKQNFNVIFYMLLSLVIGGGSLFLAIHFDLSFTATVVLLYAIYIIGSIIALYILSTWGVKRYKKIEQ